MDRGRQGEKQGRGSRKEMSRLLGCVRAGVCAHMSLQTRLKAAHQGFVSSIGVTRGFIHLWGRRRMAESGQRPGHLALFLRVVHVVQSSTRHTSFHLPETSRWPVQPQGPLPHLCLGPFHTFHPLLFILQILAKCPLLKTAPQTTGPIPD